MVDAWDKRDAARQAIGWEAGLSDGRLSGEGGTFGQLCEEWIIAPAAGDGLPVRRREPHRPRGIALVQEVSPFDDSGSRKLRALLEVVELPLSVATRERIDDAYHLVVIDGGDEFGPGDAPTLDRVVQPGRVEPYAPDDPRQQPARQ